MLQVMVVLAYLLCFSLTLRIPSTPGPSIMLCNPPVIRDR